MSRYKFNDWGKPLGADFHKFWDATIIAAKRRFGVDQDGDCPVQVMMIDRTCDDGWHYAAVPYLHKAKNAEEIEEIERMLLLNLGTAYHALDTFKRAVETQRARLLRNQKEGK